VIEELLPPAAIAVEALREELDDPLFPEELLVVGRAVHKRRAEFTTARALARIALERLGLPPAPIPTGERGEPLWPEGVVGSITHCDGYRACAVARARELPTIGIDAEPNAPLPDGLLDDIATPEELPTLQRLQLELPEVHWGRLLFSAKESIYKAWFPLAKRWLGFEDAVVELHPSACTFTATLLVPAPALDGSPVRGFSGAWLVREGIIVTAIARVLHR
jgi:4'-phosphopantetheinyl transferase EntD